MKKNNKYETPVIIPLGELVQGSGECSDGSQVHGEPHCKHGPNPSGQCSMGQTADPNCSGGSGPLRNCKSGVGG
jgi:hypothetical protein